MTKLALSVAAMLLASSAAFAGSDHFGADTVNQPVASVDTNATASIPYTAHPAGVDTKVTTGPSQGSVQDIINRHNDDGLWGR
ncbi:hypothetical protein CK228_22800 [Mesorhizobium sp. WSM4312]|uniref:DUF680 domain-containing protein n=1 Tax=unclassified Mesorhizobium TaxID=325217 RepID=UPI000BAF0804|nr:MULTISPECIES: DUF680 domain-containing protein [unclassified Mesorhizobium]PBB23430.1 hypothetical protein CK232_27970 [Mesorhizobium sp. WSM4304]PBB66382.1 hypothetical protein CK228_22800 [Mesorhizobium sp. WSM4312]PBB72277.1 hypothetical protein CK227_27670 [Mesorhizobium sp. WSM4308]TRC77463.1 DUF680 domain-containing protein [Mesorhizobium sp. WSM4315]TRC80104.1 DUF680 domain-containing protein [Mesorhizobium sp. WSM4307]